MTNTHEHTDKPEPRWQAVVALIAVGGIYFSLPKALIVGPVWLLPALIAALEVPAIVTHRLQRYSINHVLGIINNAIITAALIGSVSLLVSMLPSHREDPLRLLLSGAELWFTNVLVFSLWYWRLDGGGPNARDKHHELGSRSFIFPQMQIESKERARFHVEHWHPRFGDYLFIAFTQSSTFGPTDAPLLARWAKIFTMLQILISLTIVILLLSRAAGTL